MMTSKRVTFKSSPARVSDFPAAKKDDNRERTKNRTSSANFETCQREMRPVMVLENPRRPDYERRYFRNMLSRIKRNSDKMRARREELEEEDRRINNGQQQKEVGSDFVKVVLDRTFPHSEQQPQLGEKSGDDCAAGRRTKKKLRSRMRSLPRTKRQMKVVSPNPRGGGGRGVNEDDFWGPAGKCRSLEIVGVRSVISSRAPSRPSTPSDGQGEALRGFRSRAILNKLQRKLEQVRDHAIRSSSSSAAANLASSSSASASLAFPDHVGSLRAVRSLNEMSTLVSELNSSLIDVEDEGEVGGQSTDERVVNSSSSYVEAERVDEHIGGGAEEQTEEKEKVEEVKESSAVQLAEGQSSMPDVCQTYSTSQQTTPYGIPHFDDDGGGDDDDNGDSSNNNTPVVVDCSSLLGRGSFSDVYQGTFHHTRVAVKVFKEGCRSSYETEKEILQHLRHPNVVQLLATTRRSSGGGDSPSWSLVLELMPGGSLRDHLEAAGGAPMPPARLLAVAVDLASALVHLHSLERPILHLDVKSGNILLDSPPPSSSCSSSSPFHRALLCDFGLSRRLRHRHAAVYLSGARVGTPAWMAPEVMAAWDPGSSRQVGLTADVYGAGTVLWEMASGERPYEGLSAKQVCDSILLGCLPPLSPDFDSGAPGLCQLIRRCWREEPAERPDAEEVLATLDNMRRKAEVEAATSRPKPPTKRKQQQRLFRSTSLFAMPSPPPAIRPPVAPHGKPVPPERLTEKALQKTPSNSPRKRTWFVPRIGFPVTPMQLARQKAKLRPFSASQAAGIDKKEEEEKEEKEDQLATALRAALLKRRKDFENNNHDDDEEPQSPWKVEDQF